MKISEENYRDFENNRLLYAVKPKNELALGASESLGKPKKKEQAEKAEKPVEAPPLVTKRIKSRKEEIRGKVDGIKKDYISKNKTEAKIKAAETFSTKLMAHVDHKFDEITNKYKIDSDKYKKTGEKLTATLGEIDSLANEIMERLKSENEPTRYIEHQEEIDRLGEKGEEAAAKEAIVAKFLVDTYELDDETAKALSSYIVAAKTDLDVNVGDLNDFGADLGVYFTKIEGLNTKLESQLDKTVLQNTINKLLDESPSTEVRGDEKVFFEELISGDKLLKTHLGKSKAAAANALATRFDVRLDDAGKAMHVIDLKKGKDGNYKVIPLDQIAKYVRFKVMAEEDCDLTNEDDANDYAKDMQKMVKDLADHHEEIKEGLVRRALGGRIDEWDEWKDHEAATALMQQNENIRDQVRVVEQREANIKIVKEQKERVKQTKEQYATTVTEAGLEKDDPRLTALDAIKGYKVKHEDPADVGDLSTSASKTVELSGVVDELPESATITLNCDDPTPKLTIQVKEGEGNNLVEYTIDNLTPEEFGKLSVDELKNILNGPKENIATNKDKIDKVEAHITALNKKLPRGTRIEEMTMPSNAELLKDPLTANPRFKLIIKGKHFGGVSIDPSNLKIKNGEIVNPDQIVADIAPSYCDHTTVKLGDLTKELNRKGGKKIIKMVKEAEANREDVKGEFNMGSSELLSRLKDTGLKSKDTFDIKQHYDYGKTGEEIPMSEILKDGKKIAEIKFVVGESVYVVHDAEGAEQHKCGTIGEASTFLLGDENQKTLITTGDKKAAEVAEAEAKEEPKKARLVTSEAPAGTETAPEKEAAPKMTFDQMLEKTGFTEEKVEEIKKETGYTLAISKKDDKTEKIVLTKEGSPTITISQEGDKISVEIKSDGEEVDGNTTIAGTTTVEKIYSETFSGLNAVELVRAVSGQMNEAELTAYNQKVEAKEAEVEAKGSVSESSDILDPKKKVAFANFVKYLFKFHKSIIPKASGIDVTTDIINEESAEKVYANYQKADPHSCRALTIFINSLPEGRIKALESKGHMSDFALTKPEQARLNKAFAQAYMDIYGNPEKPDPAEIKLVNELTITLYKGGEEETFEELFGEDFANNLSMQHKIEAGSKPGTLKITKKDGTSAEVGPKELGPYVSVGTREIYKNIISGNVEPENLEKQLAKIKTIAKKEKFILNAVESGQMEKLLAKMSQRDESFQGKGPFEIFKMLVEVFALLKEASETGDWETARDALVDLQNDRSPSKRMKGAEKRYKNQVASIDNTNELFELYHEPYDSQAAKKYFKGEPYRLKLKHVVRDKIAKELGLSTIEEMEEMAGGGVTEITAKRGGQKLVVEVTLSEGGSPKAQMYKIDSDGNRGEGLLGKEGKPADGNTIGHLAVAIGYKKGSEVPATGGGTETETAETTPDTEAKTPDVNEEIAKIKNWKTLKDLAEDLVPKKKKRAFKRATNKEISRIAKEVKGKWDEKGEHQEKLDKWRREQIADWLKNEDITLAVVQKALGITPKAPEEPAEKKPEQLIADTLNGVTDPVKLTKVMEAIVPASVKVKNETDRQIKKLKETAGNVNGEELNAEGNKALNKWRRERITEWARDQKKTHEDIKAALS